jgi:hypothetical protein
MLTHTKDEDFNEYFARLYCKSKGIKPDRCSSDYADLGNSYSYVRIDWEVKGVSKQKQISPKKALDLIAQRLLDIERSVFPAKEH